MKKISLVLVSLFVVLVFQVTAWGIPSTIPLLYPNEGNTGFYIKNIGATDLYQAIFNGNDKLILPEAPYSLTLVSEIDLDGQGLTSGIWADVGATYNFYSIKSGNEFSLYELVGGASTFIWRNNTLVNFKNEPHDVSHLSVWRSTPVPIPASIFLLAPGLLGVVGLSRRRKK